MELLLKVLRLRHHESDELVLGQSHKDKIAQLAVRPRYDGKHQRPTHQPQQCVGGTKVIWYGYSAS